jgi:hypothetical protein
MMAMPTEKKVRKPRRDCKYTVEERAAIAQHKDEYLSQSTSAGRGHVFRSKILPAMFNHWSENGKLDVVRNNIEMESKVSYPYQCDTSDILRLQALGAWLANNWRPKGRAKANKTQRRVTRLDIMWRDRRDAVDLEMKEILGVDILDPSAPEYFQQRNAAARQAYDRLSEQEKLEISKLKEKYKLEANVPEIQQKCVSCQCRSLYW